MSDDPLPIQMLALYRQRSPESVVEQEKQIRRMNEKDRDGELVR